MTMTIDCYGEPVGGAERMTLPAREPNGTKRMGGATYLRFAARSPARIHRLIVDADGIVRHEWAYGMWADAKSLSYVPLETTLEVQE